MIDYTKILSFEFPGEIWQLDGDDYEGLTWLSESAKPTKEELDSLWEKVKKNYDAKIKAEAEAKAALLTKLGITADEAALLLS
jgi:hypothetical protein